MTRRSSLSNLAALAAAAVIAACSHSSADGPAGNPARPVRVAALATAAIGETVRAVGLLTPKDETRLAFKTSGVIESIRVEEGSPVRAGQLLAVLKQTETKAAVEQARQAASKGARDLKRAQALYADGVATLEQVQDLTTAAAVGAAVRRSAEFNAGYTRIVAAADGVVLRKLAEKGEVVQAGQPVLVVGGAGRGWIVRVGLADRDVVRFRIGDAATARFDAWPGRSFTGRIGNVAASADPATGTFAVEVQVQPSGVAFVQGLVAKVTLTPLASRTANVVPVQALVEANGSEAAVFVVDPLHAIARRVTIHIGEMSGGEVEVLDGLAPGCLVVIDGAAFLENGERVRIATETAAGPARIG